jgi:NAD(P)H dehydrogenase (quinone)
MKKLAVIYHSARGNTRCIAELVAEGARTAPSVRTDLLGAQDLITAPERLLAFDGFAFGSPTDLGGVSAPFKAFMDATGRLWKSHALKGKLASGFTVSALPSGDIASALSCMNCPKQAGVAA